MIRWRVWYADGSSYDSTRRSWDGLPTDGVVGLVLYHDRKWAAGRPFRQMMLGSDWYWRNVDGSFGESRDSADTPGTWLPRERYVPEGAVAKRGRWTSDDAMARVQAAMMAAETL